MAGQLASAYRADLLATGKGDGYHAYTYPTPANWKDGDPHTITGYVVDLNGGGNVNMVSNIGTPVVIDCEDPTDSEMDGTLSGPTECSIPLNGSSCSPTLAWSIINPEDDTTTMAWPGGSWIASSSITPATQSGTKAITLSATGDKIVTLTNNTVVVDTHTVRVICASGDWDGSKCSSIVNTCDNDNVHEPGNGEQCDSGGNNACWSLCDSQCRIKDNTCDPGLGCGKIDPFTCDPSTVSPDPASQITTPANWKWKCGTNQCIKQRSGAAIFIED